MSKPVHKTLLLGLILMLIPVSVGAQSATQVIIARLNTNAFPEISSYLQVYDNGGNFLHDLNAEHVTIIEDGKNLPISAIRELNPGAQFVVAVNMGPAYTIQDREGITRYERVRQALGSWIDIYPLDQENDDLSFLTNDNYEGLHYNRPVAWLSKMRQYEPNFDTSVPSLDVLARALDVAAEPSQAGTGRGVLFITPLPGEDSLAALPSLAALAKQSQTRVYIWMIASRAFFESDGATQLAQFAQQTGGRLFAFSGEESLPPIDPYVEPLRYAYTFSYLSQISEGDSHQVSVQVSNNFVNQTSEAVSFELSVQPPNPIFISPPLEIQRREMTETEDTAEETGAFTPDSQTLEILIEFPDGHNRALQNTSLYVDGEVVAENTTPPFDKFNWNISEYTNDASALIWVEALDELGLRSRSIEHQVNIRVEYAPFNLFRLMRQNPALSIGISAALVLSLAALFLIFRGNLRPRTTGRLILRKRARQPAEEHPAQSESSPEAPPEPEPQPAATRRARGNLTRWMERIAWPRRGEDTRVTAYLELADEQKIPLLQDELTFGSDPQQASITFEDQSVDALHARLRRASDEKFYLADENSTAGTWLNYQPLTTEGAPLQHGDTILIGRVKFQFKISAIEQIPKPKVHQQESL